MAAIRMGVHEIFRTRPLAVRAQLPAVPSRQSDFLLLRQRRELPPYARLRHIVESGNPPRADARRFVIVSRKPEDFSLDIFVGDHARSIGTVLWLPFRDKLKLTG